MLNIWIKKAEQRVLNEQFDQVYTVILFAILSVLLETSKESQTDLVKFYVNYVPSSNIFGYCGIILH